MRIAICHSNLGGLGGGEKFVLEQAKYFSKKHDIEIVTWQYLREKTFSGFENYDIRELHTKNHPMRKLLAWARYRGDADVFSTHGFPSNFTSFRNRKTAWYCHTLNLPFHRGYRIMYMPSRLFDKLAVWKSSKLIANSQFTHELIKDYYGRDSVVVTPGVYPEEFKPGKFGDYVLLVSRISPEKNVELALEVMKLVKGLRLVIVAGWIDERFYSASDFSRKGIEFIDKVSEKEELRKLYSNCLCVLQTSKKESFGMVPLEAMASGKPVIAPNIAGFRETVTEDTGFLTEPDAETMAQKITYLDENRDMAKKMGKNGLKRAKEFSWDNKMADLEKVLTHLSNT